MKAPGFAVWVTGPEPTRLHAIADEMARRLAERGLTVEVLDTRTPALATLADPAGVARLAASLLARHGVPTVIALPATRATRDAARDELARMIEVDVPADVPAPGHEPPERAEVAVLLCEVAAGAARALHTLEVLRFLPAATGGYSAEEERAVIRRLKAFGYL